MRDVVRSDGNLRAGSAKALTEGAGALRQYPPPKEVDGEDPQDIDHIQQRGGKTLKDWGRK